MTQREWLMRRIATLALERPTTRSGREAQQAAIHELERELVDPVKVCGYITPHEPYGVALEA